MFAVDTSGVNSILAFQELLVIVRLIGFEHGVDDHKKFASQCPSTAGGGGYGTDGTTSNGGKSYGVASFNQSSFGAGGDPSTG
jgi:hypothetical protein